MDLLFPAKEKRKRAAAITSGFAKKQTAGEENLMAKSQTLTLGKKDSLEYLVTEVMDFLEKEKKMVSEVAILPNGYFIQTKSKETWKSMIGMSLAIHILFERSGNDLTVTVNNGKWIDKIAAAGVGFITPIGAITMATAAFGAWSQQKLPGEILDKIAALVRAGVHDASIAVYRKIFAAASPDELYALAVKAEAEDKRKSLDILKIAVEKGSAKAAVKLGAIYYEGNGVEKNLGKAFDLWSRNIEALDAKTTLNLADMYRDGNVTEKNLARAFSLYVKAPHQQAEKRIMEIFDQGVDLPEYTRFAAEYYVRRFENGQDDLLTKIISLYASLGDEENLKKYQLIAAQKGDRTLAAALGKELFRTDRSAAYPLLSSADADTDPEIPFMLAKIRESGEGAAKDVKAARALYEKAAEAGYDPAVRGLADLLRQSTKKTERSRAFALYTSLAEKGDADSRYQVAKMLDEGIGTEPDAARAFALLTELAESGYPAALMDIAEAYRAGSGCGRDLERATKFASRAVAAKADGAKKLLDELKVEREKEIEAEKQAILDAAVAACENDATGEAELKVAQLYEAGEVVERSPEKVLEYYRSAAGKGNAAALYRLGKIAEDGDHDLDMSSDIAQALELYELAENLGSDDAGKALKNIKKNIKNLETEITDYILEDDNDDIENILDNAPFKYVEYEIRHSVFCGLRYFDVVFKNRPNENFSELFVDSEDVRELVIGFCHACAVGNDERCWHYAKELLKRGVYWVLSGFYEKYPLVLAAMKNHGCIEATAKLRRLWEKYGKEKDRERFNNTTKAEKINIAWLEERSQEMVFPSIFGNKSDKSEAKTSGTEGGDENFSGGFDPAGLYSMNDLAVAEKSNDREVREWVKTRERILAGALKAIKENNITAIDRWATQLEYILEQKYSSRPYDPHVPTSKMIEIGMTIGGDHLLYVYCNLVWRCHELGRMRRFKYILNEKNTTDLEFAGMMIDAWNRHRIEPDWLAAQVGLLLLDDKILSDEFLANFQ